ncbi:hypothetical protein [Streptomyces sp. SID13031]|uniref:hypothetical protein n=1 Tax=Streptomyces sp. SID13031 TaxID=2706046 RepID=UPI0013CA1B87|nr:hypothetical protein [Streptomyces sp. SID13031]NEA35206.1 hypothetical protein [Streptomyces sp. SID13031]
MNDRVVPRESGVYQEFARLYRLARSMRPTAVDRWNGTLYASDTERWGGFNGKTGSIRLSADRVLRHLTGSPSSADADEQAEALATVLHESTHAGMETDAPAEPNAVRTPHSLGATEGLAELRAMNDFPIFATLAGYPGLKLPAATYPGAHSAMDNLVTQVTGPAKDRDAFISEACQGPGVMHFDQLADGVMRNRLSEVVPFQAEHRREVRAALIATMVHPGWPVLPESSARVGEQVAEDIRRSLNAKVDEIRQHYFFKPGEVFSGGVPNPEAGREGVLDRAGAPKEGVGPGKGDPGEGHPEMRFLGGQAGAVGAVRGRPVLGDGARGRGVGDGDGRGSGPGRG